MKIFLMADVHANLPALEAILQVAAHEKPDRIISLGDQVNLGPCSVEVLELMAAHHVTCLHGNHERYILSAMQGDASFDGANFASLRFIAGLLTPDQITFPKELRIGDLCLTHAMPGNDRYPIPWPKEGLSKLSAEHDVSCRHIICGHGHDPHHYVLPELTVDVIGSAGCMDHGLPGMACFAELLLTDDGFCLTQRFAAYDPRRLRPLFIASGFADACPIMARVSCTSMEHNHSLLIPFVDFAAEIAREHNEVIMSQAVWEEADKRFPWPESGSTAAYWRH